MDTDTEFVLLTRYFYPDTASTGQLMTDLAVGLQKRGVNMTVVAGPPNYDAADAGNRTAVSEYDGIRIRRTPRFPTDQRTTVRKLADWLLFALSVLLSMLIDRPKEERELLVVSTPPFLLISAWLLQRLRGWEYTYIVYDLWPDAGVESGYFQEEGLVDCLWSWIHDRVLADAKNIVALGPAMRNRIVEGGNSRINKSDVEIIHNWEDEDFIKPKQKSENWFSKKHNLENRFVVLYSGNINPSHDLETVIDAADRLRDTDVVFVIIGEGVQKDAIVKRAKEHNLEEDTVKFFPYQPINDLPYTLTCGDVAVVTKRRRVGIAVSCKIYTTLASGLPVLCIADRESDEARAVNRYDVGKHVQPGDVQGVVKAINEWRMDRNLVDEQGERSRHVFEENFTKEAAMNQYYCLLTDE